MAFCSPVPFGTTSAASNKKKKAVCKRVRLTSCASPNNNNNNSNNNRNRNISRRESLVRLGAALLAASHVSHVSQGTQPAMALSQKRMLAKAGPVVELPDGLTYRDVTVGNGISPKSGDTVAIHYSLFYDDFEVESSRESQGLAASPIGFTYDSLVDRPDRTDRSASILPAINLGIAGMKVGGVRWIEAPPKFAYGDRGRKPMIPPGATVQFAVQLLSCKRSGSNVNISVGNSSVF